MQETAAQTKKENRYIRIVIARMAGMVIPEPLRCWLRWSQKYLLVLFAALACLTPTMSQAQSACTAIWGLTNITSEVAYLNTSSNQWVTVTSALNTTGGVCDATTLGCNAMAGRNSDGKLYFLNRTTRQLITFNPADNAIATLGSPIAAPPSPASATQILGATFDASDRLHIYATSASGLGTPAFVTFLQIDPTSGNHVGTWTQARTTIGGTPTANISGDVFIGRGGATYFISNTNPPTLHPINLTPGASYAQTTNTVTISGLLGGSVQAVSVDPATGIYYVATAAVGAVTGTFKVETPSLTVTPLNLTAMGDMGNCPSQPIAPTISKVFSPSYVAGGVGNQTSSIIITIGNGNTQPIWTFQNLTDTLPAGMFIATPASPSGSCFANSSTAFGTATFTSGSSGSVNILSANAKIPAGGCTLSFNVSATASLSPYTNTIPAGSLSTTAGSNATAASATLRVGTDFSVTKQVRAGTTAPLADTTTIAALQTMQYVLTITNSASGGTGSATFTDTLPTQITPVFSVAATMTGGGSCTTGTLTVSGATRITGTLTNAPPGAACTVTVTARGANTSGTIVNTATIAPVSSTGDTSVTNNLATATATMSPATTLTIAKTNGVNTVTYGGTTAYTVTVANLGPGNAPNALVKDAAATGLACTSVVCGTGSAGAVCPSPGSVTIAALQGSGIALTPTFSAGHSLTFRVSCNVTATGS